MWTNSYWDMLYDLYWQPDYVGLKSIPQHHWLQTETTVTIPKSMVNLQGPLYRRTRKGSDYWRFVKSREETFNHIFTLALSILPGTFISKIFGTFCAIDKPENFQSLQRNTRQRYGWKDDANVTTPDILLVSPETILAVELKFNAPTSPDQLAKYIHILTLEHMLSPQPKTLKLLYILNKNPEKYLPHHIKQSLASIQTLTADDLLTFTNNSHTQNFIQQNPKIITYVLQNTTIYGTTWSDLRKELTKISKSLDTTEGDQTLTHIVAGLIHEIEVHPLSKAV